LYAGRRLPVAAGAYAYAGRPAGLLAARRTGAAAGSFVLSPSDATLTRYVPPSARRYLNLRTVQGNVLYSWVVG
jgi:hypothetical protein